MPYLRDRVIILKKEVFREQDRRYIMYGREHGLMTAVARGSSSRTSKHAGHLEPLNEVEVMLAKGAVFDFVAVARSCSKASERGLSFYAIGGSFADLVRRLTRPGIADERIFDLLQELMQTLSGLSEELSPSRARLLSAATTLHFLDLLGFAPPIERSVDGTTPVPSLALVSFLRRSRLADVLRVTATSDIFHAASSFIEEALKQTPIDHEPHGPSFIQRLLDVR